MFRWYTLQTYSGHENKAKQNLAQRADNFNLARSFRQLVIPMETIHEVKDGQKITSEKRMMPGYLFIEMELRSSGSGSSGVGQVRAPERAIVVSIM
jgi:transcriptional antiterminator NusG